ncbi:MAG: DUF2911 domain-containing protein [Acidobacteriota bacterium]
MRRRGLLCALLLLAGSVSFSGQPKKGSIVGFGGQPSEQGTTRVLYWNQQLNSSAGEFAISYGRPVWKQDYEDPVKLDILTKGKVWRMGDNFWTVLDTNLPLKIAGREVPVGSYYLGVQRSEDGKDWTLLFIDPAKARELRLDAFEIGRAPILYRTPLSFGRSATVNEKLTISLEFEKESPTDVTLSVAWGNLNLTAPVRVTLSQ